MLWKLKDKLDKDIKRYGTVGHSPGTWQTVLSLLSMPRGTRDVLNVGCGKFTPVIPEYDVLHCDIRHIKKKGIKFIQCNLNEGIPFKHNAFEGAIAMEIIEHLENPHLFLRELTRVASNWIILTYPNNESMNSRNNYKKTGSFPWFSEEHAKKNGHISPIFSWQVRHALNKLNWKIDDTKYNNPLTKEITVQKLVPKKA